MTTPLALAGQFRTPLMKQAPVLDGNLGREEWALAAAVDGFAMNGKLDRRRARALVGATQTHIYVGILSQLPDEGELLTAIDRDTLKLVFDDAVEVWVDPTPGTEHGQTFQMLANSTGHRAYKHHGRGNVKELPTWKGNWQVANGMHQGYWHCEVGIPLADIAPGREVTTGQWGINVCRDWKQPWGFSSLGGGAYAPSDRFTFAPLAPVVHCEQRTNPTTGEVTSALRFHNATGRPLKLAARLYLERDQMPEVDESKEVVLAADGSDELLVHVEDHSSQRMKLSATVKSADGAVVYFDRSVGWDVSGPYEWKATKREVLPVDFQFAYYPYRNRMRILADVTGLPKDAELKTLTASIRKQGSAEPVKSVVFDSFEDGKQELRFALPPLQGSYEIAVTATGKNVPEGELVKEFERTVYEWEHCKLGKSRKVYPPFTPLVAAGGKVKTVLRQHDMNGLGLWDQVQSKGQPLLAQPMTFAGATVHPRSFSLRQIDDQQAVADAVFRVGEVNARAVCTWDYDGTMRYDLTLSPGSGKRLDALTLEIPLRAEQATHYHAMGDGIRNTLYDRVPDGDGVVWTAEQVQVNDLPTKFCSYLYVGTPVRGLCWFAENDHGWGWDSATPNVELVRGAGRVTLRVHLINKPLVLDKERTLTFGLLAAPVKPKLGNWRYKWHRDNYTLLGTDINWLARGNCGSVYPAGKDLFFWDMLKRGNVEQLSDEEVRKTVERGTPLFAPYGQDYVERFVRHVGHNLRSRFGKKMVFYYNRASCQLFDEFQTFQDEWCLTDFRTVGKGNGVGEIKIVPSESYIDYALYWYGKSFERGGNQGVYWDNWYLRGTYNTEMSAAYVRDDGSVAPSTGLWGLRELSKRTFQFMNEVGMLPITMPHMTSTNILPMHSFATVQYDWEWKYSQGDVQYRFPREYILLVSNGELAGTWPVLLGDHGKLARDPWTQRTFAGCSLVHELDGGGMPEVWQPLWDPIWRLLDDPKLQVYRYWDERPQPVRADNPDVPTIVYSVPGKEAVVVVTSYAEEDTDVVLEVDLEMLGFDEHVSVVDTETGQSLPHPGGKLRFPLKKHDLRQLRFTP